MIKSKQPPAAPDLAAPTPAPAPAALAVQAPAATFPQFPFNPLMFNPMMMGMGMGMGMPGMGMGMLGMPGAGGPGPPPSPRRSPRKERSSSPADIPGGMPAFYQACGVTEDEEQALEKLGFRMGDDLDQVTESEYKEAGFKPLDWRRFLKVYKRYKRNIMA